MQLSMNCRVHPIFRHRTNCNPPGGKGAGTRRLLHHGLCLSSGQRSFLRESAVGSSNVSIWIISPWAELSRTLGHTYSVENWIEVSCFDRNFFFRVAKLWQKLRWYPPWPQQPQQPQHDMSWHRHELFGSAKQPAEVMAPKRHFTLSSAWGWSYMTRPTLPK